MLSRGLTSLRHPGCAHSVSVRRGCGGRDAFPALRFRSKTVKQPNFIPRALTPCGVKCQKMQGIAGDAGDWVRDIEVGVKPPCAPPNSPQSDRSDENSGVPGWR